MSVCFSTSDTKSSIVIRCCSTWSAGVRPANDTGWKFTPRIISRFLRANDMISPTWSSFIPLTSVGTSTIPSFAFLQFSIAWSFVSRMFAARVLRYGSSVTPSNCKYTVFSPASLSSCARFSLFASAIPFVAICVCTKHSSFAILIKFPDFSSVVQTICAFAFSFPFPLLFP